MLEEERQAVILKPYMSKRYGRNPHLIIRSLVDLYRTVGSGRYSLVYVHGIRNQFLITLIPKRTKTVFDVHGLGFMEHSGIRSVIYRMLENRTFSFPDLVIVTSKRSARILRENGVNASRLRVVTNGVDQNEFVKLSRASREKTRMKLGLENKFVIVSINNPSEPANVRALALLESVVSRLEGMNVGDVQFLVIGMDVTAGRSADKIKYLGFIDNLNEVLNTADAAILSYPDDAGRTGPLNKTLQFMACKLPIVSTTNGMMGIENARNGVHYMHSEASDRDLVNKLLMIKENPHLGNRLGENARDLILRDYTWEKQAEKVNDMFRNA
jgi:glycosyltransferase involved in cell wall biosynthesis